MWLDKVIGEPGPDKAVAARSTIAAMERQWQNAGFPKLGTKAGDWFHTNYSSGDVYVIATGIYDNMLTQWWNCGGLFAEDARENKV